MAAGSKWINGLQKVKKVYHYRFKFRNKVYHGSTRCTSYADAKDWLEAFRNQLSKNGVGIFPIPTFGGLLAEWQKAMAPVLPNQVVMVVRQMQLHCGSLMNQPVNLVTASDIQEVVNKYKSSKGVCIARNGYEIEMPHTSGGARTLYRRIRILLNYAVSKGHMAPFKFKIAFGKKQKKPRPILAPRHTVRFHKEIGKARNPHVHLAVKLMLHLGLRESEAYHARWEWVDFENRVYVPGHSKTGDIESVPIPQWLLTELEQHPDRKQSGLMMPSEIMDEQGQPLPHYSQFATKRIAAAGKALGVLGMGPHRLRATFLTNHVLKAGTSLSEAQRLGRHAEINTTNEHYIEAFGGDSLHEAQENLAEVCGMNSDAKKGNTDLEYNI